ncbi:MAG TPA: glycosyltransferase family 2 protein [Candidatus Woesebacteria bacterium]|nr:glycosyltransferase family 2 protein [Candidatus Woesebacteria bacterium]
MNNISAIIVANGNPPHIFESIRSISELVNEIIIVDIGLDLTIINKLKENKLVVIKKIKEEILYVELIREKSKDFAKNEYVLFLDHDELLSPALVHVLKNEYKNYDFFSIPRKNIIMGKWIEYSRWWPDYQIRLFKKNHVKWPVKLHAQPEIEGNGYTVEQKENLAIIHYNYENLTEYFTKMIRYANAESQELIQKNKIPSLQETITKSLQEFISRYFAHRGYKDGTHGFVLAFLQMMYCFVVYFYYWENKKYHVQKDINIEEGIQLFFKQGLYETNYWLEKEGHTTVSLKEKILRKILK